MTHFPLANPALVCSSFRGDDEPALCVRGLRASSANSRPGLNARGIGVTLSGHEPTSAPNEGCESAAGTHRACGTGRGIVCRLVTMAWLRQRCLERNEAHGPRCGLQRRAGQWWSRGFRWRSSQRRQRGLGRCPAGWRNAGNGRAVAARRPRHARAEPPAPASPFSALRRPSTKRTGRVRPYSSHPAQERTACNSEWDNTRDRRTAREA